MVCSLVRLDDVSQIYCERMGTGEDARDIIPLPPFPLWAGSSLKSRGFGPAFFALRTRVQR